MKLNDYDLDQVEREARALEERRLHEARRGRKGPEEDTIRIPVKLLLALLEEAKKPKRNRYVKPGVYCEERESSDTRSSPAPACNPHNFSMAELVDSISLGRCDYSMGYVVVKDVKVDS